MRTPATLSRRDVLRAGAASATLLAAGPLLSACEPTPSGRPAWRQSFTTPGSRDVTVVDAGGWCWFSESRTLITSSGRLFVGSVAGLTGTARDGSIEVTSVDVRGGLRPEARLSRTTVDPGTRVTIGQHTVDDHNNPGLEETAAGGVVAMWAAHGTDTLLRTATAPPGSGLLAAGTPIERPEAVVQPGKGVSYGTVHRLADAGVLLACYRGEQYSWNLLRSVDDGQSWEYLGLILVPPYRHERPYAKFASDGRRLWFATTEGHPRTYQPTRVRAGWIDPEGRISAPDGSPLGQTGPGVPVHSVPIVYDTPAHADTWVSEIRIVAGRPVVTGSLRGARVDTAAGAYVHDHLRIMEDPGGSGGWIRELVAHGGGELGGYVAEPDYSGLTATDPSTHNRVVVATNVHPTTGAPLVSSADRRVHFELWEMNRSSDGSGRWIPTALTADSTEDHIRPHIALQGTTKVLSWMQGEYRTAQRFRTRIVSRQAA